MSEFASLTKLIIEGHSLFLFFTYSKTMEQACRIANSDRKTGGTTSSSHPTTHPWLETWPSGVLIYVHEKPSLKLTMANPKPKFGLSKTEGKWVNWKRERKVLVVTVPLEPWLLRWFIYIEIYGHLCAWSAEQTFRDKQTNGRWKVP